MEQNFPSVKEGGCVEDSVQCSAVEDGRFLGAQGSSICW